MVSVLVSSAVDRGFESGQTKYIMYYKIVSVASLLKHAALRK